VQRGDDYRIEGRRGETVLSINRVTIAMLPDLKLILAAPVMLEALQAVARSFGPGETDSPLHARVNAAIRAAEGEA